MESAAGPHSLAIDMPGQDTFDQQVTLRAGVNALDLTKICPSSRYFGFVQRSVPEAIVGQGGAWEFYKSQSFPGQQSAAAEALMYSALEETGQDCVSDYVQSTTNALKAPMFLRAAEAFTLVAYTPPKRSRRSKQSSNSARHARKSPAGEFAEAVDSSQSITCHRFGIRVLVQCAWRCTDRPESG